MDRTAKTRDAAIAKVHQAIERLRNDEPLRKSTETFEAVAQRWIDTTAALSGMSESTQDQYRGALRLYLNPVIGHIKVADLKPSDIEQVDAGLKARGLSPTTRRKAITCARHVLRTAKRDGLVSRVVADEVSRPPLAAASPKAYTAAQERAVVDAAAGHRFFPVIALMAATGASIAEVLAIAESDLDLDSEQPSVYIRGALVPIPGKGLVLTDGKTKSRRRRVPLSAKVVPILKDWKRQRAADRLLLGPDWTESGYLFVTGLGTPVHRDNVRKWYAKLVRTVKVDGEPVGGSPHWLRHTFGTHLLNAGVNPKVVADLMGHASTKQLLDTYAASLPEQRAAAITHMDAVL